MLIHSISYKNPLAAFSIFASEPRAVFLDSATQNEKSRYSIIAVDPFSVIEASGANVTVDGKSVALDPFTALERELKKYASPSHEAPTPFTGGAIGFFGYELGGWLERLPKPRADALDITSLAIGFYDAIIVFDNLEKKAWILSHGWPEKTAAARDARAQKRAEFLAERFAQAPQALLAPDWILRGNWQAELTRVDAEERIARIIEYIRAGDIFQANFTQRFRAKRPSVLDDFMLYRRLRTLNPAPFATFLRCGERLSLAGASPERFLRLNADGIAEAHPIKGTRPRDPHPARDAELACELQESAKDRAENLMIVDLMRNDLSRVCEPGSVNVPQLCALESFENVHHLVSIVTGKLKANRGPVDLLRASFPGGSVTGAPKIRAMEIIHELEPAPRGAYCGCLGWIGFDGAMDMSMTIRTLTIAGDMILAQAGGGIVADSDPAAEYEESMIKITPLLRALTGEGR
jgi:para-aminobenzoate synthetase component 1